MSDFRPYPELRWLVPPHTTTERPKLQQRWIKDTYNGFGHVNGCEEEWRDVPRVVEQKADDHG